MDFMLLYSRLHYSGQEFLMSSFFVVVLSSVVSSQTHNDHLASTHKAHQANCRCVLITLYFYTTSIIPSWPIPNVGTLPTHHMKSIQGRVPP